MAEYSVRYESDGQVTRIFFLVPKPEKLTLIESEVETMNVANAPTSSEKWRKLAAELKRERNAHFRSIVMHGAGLLFLGDCCPGEDFCVYEDDDRSKPVLPVSGETHEFHHYYGDDDGLWPTDESEIMDG